MRKHEAAFADNAQAAPALPDKHTRKQKECGGGSPAQPGVPSPTTAVRVTRHPAQGLCALRAPGRSSGMWVPPHNGGTHEALSGAGVAASRTCLRHSHCPPFPSPAGGRARHGRDEMGWAVPACRLRPFCSGAALPVPPRPGRRGQGPVPRVLTLWVSNGGGTNLGLSRTSCSSTEVSWSRQSQAAKGGQTQPLGSISSSCSHPQPRIDPHTHSREIG